VATGYRGGRLGGGRGRELAAVLIGNLGTLEAGWTAAFTALGVPLEVAAATGLAAHMWGLIFAAVFGGAAWAVLSLSRNGGNVRTLNVKR